MIGDRKILLLIFLFVVITVSSATPLLLLGNREVTDVKLRKLIICLKAVGVDAKNIYTRDSGIQYEELNFQWNTLNGYLHPLVYLVATSNSDIRKAVICSKFTKIRIVPRSGGHSYVKNGFGDSRSFIVDLASFNQITVDPAQMTCEVRPGARNGMITYALWEKGYVVPQGFCPSVGVGGLALGGGYGHFARLFGLTSDNVVEIDMIDARGQLLKINRSTNKDLFWALRGGGGGNFGIVSKFKIKIYPAPLSVANGIYEYHVNDFEKFFTAYQSLITSSLPNNIFCWFEMEKELLYFQLYSYNGNTLENVSVDNIESLLKSMDFPVPTKSSTKLMSHTEFVVSEAQAYSNTLVTHPSQMANMTKHYHVGWKKVKSFYIGKILKKREISKLAKLVTDYVKDACLMVEFFGGAVNDLSPSETAFVHRGQNLHHIQLKPHSSQSEQPNPIADAAMKTFYEETKSIFDHKESYQNYMDADMPDYLTRYYGENLEKLIQIKRKVDPENMFYHPESIPVDFVRIH